MLFGPIEIIVISVVGVIISFLMGWIIAKLYYQSNHNEEILSLEKGLIEVKAAYDNEKKSAREKLELYENLKTSFSDMFQALSAASLRENNKAFIDLAGPTFARFLDAAKTDFEAKKDTIKDIVEPVREKLNKYDDHIRQMERVREKAYGGLSEQVNSLLKSQQVLEKETGRLVNALQRPHVRGRWGEITLRRVAELSGMHGHCDFFEQETAGKENNLMRPDMIIRLPGNRKVIVDSKVPLSAYLDSIEANDEADRELCLERHVRHVKSHITSLAQKAYWMQFSPTPEFVILFIPGENFFSAALEKDKELIEKGANKGVILATPTTLITLLKTIEFSWRQEKVAENARAISEVGHEMYDRLWKMTGHFNNLGRDIKRVVDSYNQTVGSFERRVLKSAGKFKELGIVTKKEKESEPMKVKKIDLYPN